MECRVCGSDHFTVESKVETAFSATGAGKDPAVNRPTDPLVTIRCARCGRKPLLSEREELKKTEGYPLALRALGIREKSMKGKSARATK